MERRLVIAKGILLEETPIQGAMKIPAGVTAALEGAKEVRDTLEQVDQIHQKLQTTNSNDKNALKDVDESEKKLQKLIEDKEKLMEKQQSKCTWKKIGT